MVSTNNVVMLSSDKGGENCVSMSNVSPTTKHVEETSISQLKKMENYVEFKADIKNVLYSTSALGGNLNTPSSLGAKATMDDCESSDTSRNSSCSDISSFSDSHMKERRLSALGSGGDGQRRFTSTGSSATSRIFWSAGTDDDQKTRNFKIQDGTVMDHARISPKYLHTNATSHKWAFGAIAELLDNAVDEIGHGATYVKVNKIRNPRDNSPALLIEDNGGGMNPNSLRECMSFGFSRKDHPKLIGKYGNGFKTSTMRLGADVIVFTRHHDMENRFRTQSVGVLSYTFLRKEGFDDVVVPMIDYKIAKDKAPKELLRNTQENWKKNLQCILEWSPFMSETELLSEFLDMGSHGTRIIIYNLWLNSDGDPELDFDADEHDIQLRGNTRLDQAIRGEEAEAHIANRYQFSLRVYASILYLRKPKNFEIILREKVVNHYDIVSSLIHVEEDTYKPKLTDKQGLTHLVKTKMNIGFIEETRLINVHGFNLYHKNRLIMPFLKVFMENSSRGRGVVGVLEANFIAPAHDKQEFERTSIFSRLTTKLRDLQVKYWNNNGHKVGYQHKPPAVKKRGAMAAPKSNSATQKRGRASPLHDVSDEDSETFEGTKGSKVQTPLPSNPDLPDSSKPLSSRRRTARCTRPKSLPVREFADIQKFVRENSTAAPVEKAAANTMVAVETSPGSLTVPASTMFGIKSRVEELEATVEEGFRLVRIKDQLVRAKDRLIRDLQKKVEQLEGELRRSQLIAQPNGFPRSADGQMETANAGKQKLLHPRVKEETHDE